MKLSRLLPPAPARGEEPLAPQAALAPDGARHRVRRRQRRRDAGDRRGRLARRPAAVPAPRQPQPDRPQRQAARVVERVRPSARGSSPTVSLLDDVAARARDGPARRARSSRGATSPRTCGTAAGSSPGSCFGTEPAYRDVTNLVVTRGPLPDRRGHAHEAATSACSAPPSADDALRRARPARRASVRVGSDYYAVVGVVARRGTAPASGAGASGDEDTRDLRAARRPRSSASARSSPSARAAAAATSASSCTRSWSRRRASRTCPRRRRRCGRCSRSATRSRTCA